MRRKTRKEKKCCMVDPIVGQKKKIHQAWMWKYLSGYWSTETKTWLLLNNIYRGESSGTDMLFNHFLGFGENALLVQTLFTSIAVADWPRYGQYIFWTGRNFTKGEGKQLLEDFLFPLWTALWPDPRPFRVSKLWDCGISPREVMAIRCWQRRGQRLALEDRLYRKSFSSA